LVGSQSKIIFNFVKIRLTKNGYITKYTIQYPIKTRVPIRLLENKIIDYKKEMSFYPAELIEVCINSPDKFKAILIRNGEKNQTVLDLGLHASSSL